MGLLSGMMGHASEVSIEKLAKEFQPILMDTEQIERAYKLIRDMLVFTNKRLILVNRQGLTGSKTDYQSIPYSSIKMFSKESAGIGDLDAELKIWLTGESEPTIKQDFRKGDNINEAYRVLSRHVLK
ncbi:PH domain-containing protein [Pontibacter actiniarum]|nr:PH domain-containing protein [Pontibacter actiniarum]